MKKEKIIILSSLLLLLIISCKCEDSVTPSPPNKPDTTFQNFTFKKWEFGNTYSHLYDVAIIDENNIWAVGEIYTEDTYTYDSNGVWIEPYNAAHWNGEKWELKRILFYIFCEQEQKAPCPAQAIYYLGNNLLAIGSTTSQITYIKDGIQKQIECLPSSITKIWGSSGKNIYVVGYNGNIARYNGKSWIKLKTSTETKKLDIYDIKGFTKNHETTLYAVAAKRRTNRKKQILKIQGYNVEEVTTDGLQFSISGIWGIVDKVYYVVGSGIYKKKDIEDNNPWEELYETRYYSYSVDGQAVNDVVCCGASGELLHYNGSKWLSFKEQTFLDYGDLLRVKIKDNIIVSVGYNNPKAVIVLGKR